MGATDKVFGNPLHPYTRMLLASVPAAHGAWEAAFIHPWPRTTTATCRSSSWKPTISPQSEEAHGNHHVHTEAAPVTLSFMVKDDVGRELGYGAADE